MMRDIWLLVLFVCVSTIVEQSLETKSTFKTESNQSNESSNTENKIPKPTVDALSPSKENEIRNSTSSIINGSTKSGKQGLKNPNKPTGEQDGQPAQAPPKSPTPPKDMNDARDKAKQVAEQAAQFKDKMSNLRNTGWGVIKWPFIVAIGSLVDNKDDAFSLKKMLQKANEDGESYKEQIEIFRSAIILMDVRNKVHLAQAEFEKGKLFKTANRFTKMFALDMQLYTKQATESGPNSYYDKTIKSDYFMNHYDEFYNVLKKLTADRLKEQVPGLSKMG